MFQRTDPCKILTADPYKKMKWSDRSIGLMWQYNINDRADLWLISRRYDTIDIEFAWEWLVNYFETVESLNNSISILFRCCNILSEKHAQAIHTGKGSCE